MSGFDCEFVEEPPKWLQTHCPVCLLILCEPYQVTCCGKSFCKECIKKIKARSQPCPTCKQDEFESFPNKGLQQPLYGFAVFCSNKERGCVWEGELGQLDQHINSNPDKEKQLVGCGYTNIVCLFCDKLHLRHEMEQHQTSLCPKRPYTCFMCEAYESIYEDVLNSHAPVCKCRPVECPNSCGADNLQHQHLEEHMSSQCPLTYVECEFSDAGCDVMVYRKDLASHLTDNLVTHMSLLAMENRKLQQQAKIEIGQLKLQLEQQGEQADMEIRKLKLQLDQQDAMTETEIRKLRLQLAKQEETTKCLESQLELERKFTRTTLSRVPPILLLCPAKFLQDEGKWSPEPFYSRISDRKLQVEFEFVNYMIGYVKVWCNLQDEQFCNLQVTIVLSNHLDGSQDVVFTKNEHRYTFILSDAKKRFVRSGYLHFCITDIQ